MTPDTCGRCVALASCMDNDNLKDKIDNTADKAKDVADKAGEKIKHGAEEVAGKAHDAKVKDMGRDAGKKIGG